MDESIPAKRASARAWVLMPKVYFCVWKKTIKKENKRWGGWARRSEVELIHVLKLSTTTSTQHKKQRERDCKSVWIRAFLLSQLSTLLSVLVRSLISEIEIINVENGKLAFFGLFILDRLISTIFPLAFLLFFPRILPLFYMKWSNSPLIINIKATSGGGFGAVVRKRA